jgi:outer membrane protein assembly factor BamB
MSPSPTESHLSHIATVGDADRWPVRVWPGLIILVAIAGLMVVPGLLLPLTMVHFISVFAAPILGALVAVVWWTFGARVRGRERWLFPVLLLVPAVILAVTLFRSTPMAIPVYALPVVTAVWVVAFALTPTVPRGIRRTVAAGAMIAAWILVGMTRFVGTTGDLVPNLAWRWQPTSEQQFEAESASRAKATPVVTGAVVIGPGDWPAFRGLARDGRLSGVRIDTNWAAHPPELVWKFRVGPGWGSFAVVGDRLFTQEQRGDEEAVVCYAADTFAGVWEYRHSARFQEAMAGPGPRATPTIHDGKVYAQGATGKLVCLDATTGKAQWVADVTAEAQGVLPMWGYSASPLVIDGVVVVYAGGLDGKGTAAYHADTGKLAWVGGQAKHSYSSAHPASLDGVSQVLMVSDYGLEAFRPTDGKLLWEYVQLEKGLQRSTQPMVIGDKDVLFGTGVGNAQGLRRLKVTRSGEEWKAELVWTSKALKPYFNDGVVVKTHLYGFDDARFCCIDLATGKEAWKEGRYGHGQVLALVDQGVLVVQAEDGRVVLVEANPADHNELAAFPALTTKTWNHPVIAHGRLFVRNDQEAACYRLKME